MNSIAINKSQSNLKKQDIKFINPFKLLLNKYIASTEANNSEKVYWYMKVIIVIPCAVMVPTILLMQFLASSFVWFIGLTMILFFANVMIHLTDLKSAVYIPLYHISIVVMFIIPLITYLISL